MVDLLVLDENATADVTTRPVTSFGGVPAVPSASDFAWPRCGDLCEEPMQFLGKVVDPSVPDGSRLVLVFMCDNPETAGGCETWDADAGANAAVLVAVDPAGVLEPVAVPEGPSSTRGAWYGAEIASVDVPGARADRAYSEAMDAWRTAHPDRPGRCVVGGWGGAPSFVQGDETPTCDGCDRPMGFVAHVEEGPDHRTAANFGGGVG
ncbi:MAG TPA: hypothetical protein VGE77_00310, partial [Nocardioides sp.]